MLGPEVCGCGLMSRLSGSTVYSPLAAAHSPRSPRTAHAVGCGCSAFRFFCTMAPVPSIAKSGDLEPHVAETYVRPVAGCTNGTPAGVHPVWLLSRRGHSRGSDTHATAPSAVTRVTRASGVMTVRLPSDPTNGPEPASPEFSRRTLPSREVASHSPPSRARRKSVSEWRPAGKAPVISPTPSGRHTSAPSEYRRHTNAVTATSLWRWHTHASPFTRHVTRSYAATASTVHWISPVAASMPYSLSPP
mmetsp:Transcript_22088/g.57653  ORF Transcript_22088/g.57653 Transcript_22088/m.57653 type:complete len:247 (+) Transcript_22088:746-1486(+)